MRWVTGVGRKVAGLFVDDSFLGGATVMSALLAGLCRMVLGAHPLLAGALLAGACCLGLTLSVLRAGGRDHA